MEWIRTVRAEDMAVPRLQAALSLQRLPECCDSIDTVQVVSDTHAEIYCLWGSFQVSREVLRYGVRFSLLNCPHALAWSITYHASNACLVIQCTIDKTETETDSEFSESIEDFVEDWQQGLQTLLVNGKLRNETAS